MTIDTIIILALLLFGMFASMLSASTDKKDKE